MDSSSASVAACGPPTSLGLLNRLRLRVSRPSEDGLQLVATNNARSIKLMACDV